MSEIHQGNGCTFVLRSNIDNQEFSVDKKIIDSSALLKNICEITEITEPISINCPADSLKVYINLINHYQPIENVQHDSEFEKNLYDSATTLKNHSYTKNRKAKKNSKKILIKLIQDLCLLDSDFFLDSISDYILGIIGNEEKHGGCWNYIREYLGLEDDFSQNARELMENDERLEYFLSINTETFKFPFRNKNLYSLKTDFSTPMNILIARIIQRSDERVSYLLSQINKTLKNEVDRYPLKVTEFSADLQKWRLRLSFNKIRKNFTLYLDCSKNDYNYFHFRKLVFNEMYINILKRRKIIVKEEVSMDYNILDSGECFIECNSLDFVIAKSAKIGFQKSYKTMYSFDSKKCPISSLLYNFCSINEREIKFEEFYKHLIAKDLSKQIRIEMSNDIFFFNRNFRLRFFKKTNASQFEFFESFIHYQSIQHVSLEFKNFVMKYMEDDGTIITSVPIPGISLDDETCVTKIGKRQFDYKVSGVKKYIACIVVK